jgi:hypothetical protein
MADKEGKKWFWKVLSIKDKKDYGNKTYGKKLGVYGCHE